MNKVRPDGNRTTVLEKSHKNMVTENYLHCLASKSVENIELFASAEHTSLPYLSTEGSKLKLTITGKLNRVFFSLLTIFCNWGGINSYCLSVLFFPYRMVTWFAFYNKN